MILQKFGKMLTLVPSTNESVLKHPSDRTYLFLPTSNPTRSAPPHPTYNPDGLALSPSAVGAIYELAAFIATFADVFYGI